MIHWTPSGVVSTPTTVQIRLTKSTSNSLRVGVDEPTRMLSQSEFIENVQYFRIGLNTPRSIPCNSLTLSGLPSDPSPYLDALRKIDRFHFTTLHLTSSSVWDILYQYNDLIDRFVLAMHPKMDTTQIPNWAISKLYCVVSLSGDPLVLEQWLEQWLPWTIQKEVDVVFSHPFPLGALPPLSPSDITKLFKWLDPLLVQMPNRILVKGIPPCLIPTLQNPNIQISSKTSNRWYVDAEHQREKALLFFPDVLQFHKDDQCRFCQKDDYCDGFFLEFLQQHNSQLSAFMPET